MIAKYYCNLGKSVTIIEPNELLAQQAASKLATLDFGISVMTIEWFYENNSNDEVVIIDEYDEIFSKLPYHIYNDMIQGIWLFKER